MELGPGLGATARAKSLGGASLVTASLAAIFVEKDVEAEEKHMEHDLMRELKHVREELQALRDEIKAKNNP